MLSGQGWTAVAGCRQFFYARYIDWMITFPLITVLLGFIAGSEWSVILGAIGAQGTWTAFAQNLLVAGPQGRRAMNSRRAGPFSGVDILGVFLSGQSSSSLPSTWVPSPLCPPSSGCGSSSTSLPSLAFLSTWHGSSRPVLMPRAARLLSSMVR